MNTPITAHSKALADEGRAASEELVKAKHEIIAELTRVTAENARLKAQLESSLNEWRAVRAELNAAHATIARLVSLQEA